MSSIWKVCLLIKDRNRMEKSVYYSRGYQWQKNQYELSNQKKTSNLKNMKVKSRSSLTNESN